MRTQHQRRHLLQLQHSEPPSERVLAQISLSAIQNNYRILRDQASGLSVLPMIKANAYGHGAEHVARRLETEPGLYGFGVATLEEGRQLREALGTARRGRSGKMVPIIVFSGASPWRENVGHFCEKHALTPVITSEECWVRFRREGWPERIRYELEFNTGMNRLGIAPAFAKQVLKDLKGRGSVEHPSGVFSHLAESENPDSPLSRQQLDQFSELRQVFSAALPGTHFHLANSGGIWNSKHWKLDQWTDVVRPGLSLYGVPPWPDAPARGLVGAMTVQAQVIQVLNLKPGDRVGYGGEFRVDGKKNPQGLRVATLAIGYADGLHRVLGGSKGHFWVADRRVPILGRISMDLTAIQCPEGVKAGDAVTVLGSELGYWAQAKEAQTIPYELLTSVSDRVKRIYVD